jgi:putative Mn2+ efflux pump MntP
MSIITTIAIAVALSMDAFAVAIVNGATLSKLRIHHALNMAFFFGAFQALMPIIGWLAGRSVYTYIEPIDHWIAFILLSGIGIKMIYESFKIKTLEEKKSPINMFVLVILSIATSIDALAVGISLSFIDSIAIPAITIGMTTFLFSYIGIYIGKRIGHLFENKITFIGGVLLILIGVKILLEHLSHTG